MCLPLPTALGFILRYLEMIGKYSALPLIHATPDRKPLNGFSQPHSSSSLQAFGQLALQKVPFFVYCALNLGPCSC
jgi:hypothetical protein